MGEQTIAAQNQARFTIDKACSRMCVCFMEGDAGCGEAARSRK
jgi:hypothetical protein